MGKESSIGGGGTRVTESHSDGSSTDKDYVSKCVAITDHERDGSSHSHEVGHGWLGSFRGDKK